MLPYDYIPTVRHFTVKILRGDATHALLTKSMGPLSLESSLCLPDKDTAVARLRGEATAIPAAASVIKEAIEIIVYGPTRKQM
jgi:hypothetical protein